MTPPALINQFISRLRQQTELRFVSALEDLQCVTSECVFEQGADNQPLDAVKYFVFEVIERPANGPEWRGFRVIKVAELKYLPQEARANPSVNAVLPRTKHNPGGGRIKYIHPVIAQGAGYPSVNIRLFEPEPVKPETLLEWEMLDEPTLDMLAGMIRRSMRGFIVGGTSSGKTTLLSMLCNFLPVGFRVMTIEDPQEIWIDNPHVVTLQARPASAGSELKSYLLRDGVDDAMRMTPDYLVVGEVRDGQAAQGLFRAMMSDHPGMSTFHAESPELAVERIALLLEADTGTGQRSARRMFSSAVDWLLQIGFDSDGKRRVMELVEVSDRLKKKVLRFLNQSHIKALYHRIEKDDKNFGRVFVHFKF